MVLKKAVLALESGKVFVGTSFGATGEKDGEVVFNTSISGYQEILTDPSYHGQIVCMTQPHIGNYGVNPEDMESKKAFVSGFVVREASPVVSNWRAKSSLSDFLNKHNIIGIEGINDNNAMITVNYKSIAAAYEKVMSAEKDEYNEFSDLKDLLRGMIVTDKPYETIGEIIKQLGAKAEWNREDDKKEGEHGYTASKVYIRRDGRTWELQIMSHHDYKKYRFISPSAWNPRSFRRLAPRMHRCLVQRDAVVRQLLSLLHEYLSWPFCWYHFVRKSGLRHRQLSPFCISDGWITERRLQC